MIVVRAGGARASARRSDTFSGEVWMDALLEATDGVAANQVHFTPGARTFWHHHTDGQLLVVTVGRGLVCAEDEAPQELRPGDVVWTPPGQRHWHGAAADAAMSHLAVSLGPTVWADEVDPAS